MKILRVLLSLTLVAILSPFAMAQDDGYNLSRHDLVDVKGGMGPQFEAAFKAHIQWQL